MLLLCLLIGASLLSLRLFCLLARLCGGSATWCVFAYCAVVLLVGASSHNTVQLLCLFKRLRLQCGCFVYSSVFAYSAIVLLVGASVLILQLLCILACLRFFLIVLLIGASSLAERSFCLSTEASGRRRRHPTSNLFPLEERRCGGIWASMKPTPPNPPNSHPIPRNCWHHPACPLASKHLSPLCRPRPRQVA